MEFRSGHGGDGGIKGHEGGRGLVGKEEVGGSGGRVRGTGRQL